MWLAVVAFLSLILNLLSPFVPSGFGDVTHTVAVFLAVIVLPLAGVHLGYTFGKRY